MQHAQLLGSSNPDDARRVPQTDARPNVSDSASSAAQAAGARASDDASTVPARAGLVLTSLIVVAGVANLNLSVANVALPDIGKHFDSSQTTLDLIAVGYSLGLACSVLWLGALGDRYGRKLMLVLGTALAIPMSSSPRLRPPTSCSSSHGSAGASPRGWPTRRRWR